MGIVVVAPPQAWWESSLFAALLGALVGGGLSILAGRLAESHARRLRDESARAALISRLLLMAEGTQGVGIALPTSDPSSATAVVALRELLAIWEPFDGMTPDLHLLGDLGLQREVFETFLQARLMSRALIDIEARAAQNDRDADSGSQRALERWERERQPVLNNREMVRREGPALAKRATVLASSLRALAQRRTH